MPTATARKARRRASRNAKSLPIVFCLPILSCPLLVGSEPSADRMVIDPLDREFNHQLNQSNDHDAGPHLENTLEVKIGQQNEAIDRLEIDGPVDPHGRNLHPDLLVQRERSVREFVDNPLLTAPCSRAVRKESASKAWAMPWPRRSRRTATLSMKAFDGSRPSLITMIAAATMTPAAIASRPEGSSLRSRADPASRPRSPRSCRGLGRPTRGRHPRGPSTRRRSRSGGRRAHVIAGRQCARLDLDVLRQFQQPTGPRDAIPQVRASSRLRRCPGEPASGPTGPRDVERPPASNGRGRCRRPCPRYAGSTAASPR